MSDEDVATRAPEGDAAEDEAQSTSTFNDKRAQQSDASKGLGEHCTTDPPLPTSASQPSGEMTTLNDVECYISKPTDYPHAPSKLLLLLSNARGIHSVNNQLQADAFADRGFLTVMPDQFAGDAMSTTKTEVSGSQSSDEQTPSIIERLKMGIAETAKSFTVDMWLARQSPQKVLSLLYKAIDGAQEAYGDAVANGGGIYGVGYCFGAKYVMLLLGDNPDGVAQGQRPAGSMGEEGESKGEPKLKAGAIAHGTLITREDMDAVRHPVMMICIPDDPLFPNDVRKAGMDSLAKNLSHMENSYREVVYEGVPHGFATVGEYDDDHIRSSQKKAFKEMCEFLEQH